MQYLVISASKSKTELPNRTAFNVCIRLTKLNWCVLPVGCKPFLWKSRKLLCLLFVQLKELNLCLDSESLKHVSSRSCVLIFRSETKTDLPNRTGFNVCIELTKLNLCGLALVCKPFLWRSRKRILSAKSKHLSNSKKISVWNTKKMYLPTALLGSHSTYKLESAFRFREFEARFF